jgi:hypothetical protein
MIEKIATQKEKTKTKEEGEKKGSEVFCAN